MWKAVKWSMASLVVVLAIVLAGVVGYALNDGESASGSVSTSQDGSGGDGFEILDEIYDILGEDFQHRAAVERGEAPSLPSRRVVHFRG